MRHAIRREYWQRRIDALMVASTNELLLRERLADVFGETHIRDTEARTEASGGKR